MCNYSDGNIVVKETIDFLAAVAHENKKSQKNVTLKNNVEFRSCISKFNNTLIDIAEDLDIVMLMYNLLEHSDNYFMISGGLRSYYSNEIDGIDANASQSKSYKFKTKITRKTAKQPPQPKNEEDASTDVREQYKQTAQSLVTTLKCKSYYSTEIS